MITGIDHVQLAMPPHEEDRARPFFTLLGFTEIEKPEPLRSRGGLWFQAGSAQLHLGVQPDFVPATKAHPAFLVDDLAQLCQTLEQNNITIKTDPATPDVPRFFINDPFGNRLEFIQTGFGFT